MLTKNDLERLAEMRLDDALLLMREGRHSSAYYLAGYSVELGLKACVSILFQPNAIPDKTFVQAIYTHKLDVLLNVAGLLPLFSQDSKSDSLLSANWGIVTKWNEESRYELWDAVSAATLLDAIIEPAHGVFQWIKRRW